MKAKQDEHWRRAKGIFQNREEGELHNFALAVAQLPLGCSFLSISSNSGS
jgi:hypothetical protein